MHAAGRFARPGSTQEALTKGMESLPKTPMERAATSSHGRRVVLTSARGTHRCVGPRQRGLLAPAAVVVGASSQ